MTTLTIGRNKDCPICLNDQAVSKIHATLIIEGNRYSIKDEDSTNGTFINGNRIYGTYVLKENDIVKVGNSILPWKNYCKAPIPQPAPPLAPVINLSPDGPQNKKKKPSSSAWLVSLLIISVIAGLIALFFYKSNQDELRINATWACTANCGNLRQMILKKITADNGDYEYRTQDSNSVKGTWTINKTDKTLHLRPGILQATSGFTSFSEEVYKYNLNKNTMSLTRYENGVTSGNEITFVKQP
jgi:hypothetical protein